MCVRLHVCLNARVPRCRLGKQTQSLIGVPGVFSQVRNIRVWDRCYGFWPPGHPDVAGDYGELRTGVQVFSMNQAGRRWVGLEWGQNLVWFQVLNIRGLEQKRPHLTQGEPGIKYLFQRETPRKGSSLARYLEPI